jgi:hypothetical protein
MYIIGQIVGGFLMIYLLSMLFEWAVMKRVFNSRYVGVPASVLAAVAVAIIVSGFGDANGGSWDATRMAPAIIVAGVIVLAIRMLTEKPRPQQDVEDTFT